MKANKHLTGCLGLTLLLLMACGPKRLPGPELVRWMEDPDNGLRQTKTEAGVSYVLQYKTMDYILAARGNPLDSADGQTRLIRKDADKNLLFDLYLTCEDGRSSPLQYRAATAAEINDRYLYYHFGFIRDIYLRTEDRDIKPLYCIADKGSGLNNTLSFSIGFEKAEIGDSDFRFVVNDTRLGSGTVKFLFKNKYFRTIPLLKD